MDKDLHKVCTREPYYVVIDTSSSVIAPRDIYTDMRYAGTSTASVVSLGLDHRRGAGDIGCTPGGGPYRSR